MHQSFVSTAPPPTGMGGDSDPSLYRALIQAPPCTDKLIVTTLLLAPPYTIEKLTGGRRPNVITPALPQQCGDNQKVLALHHSPAIPRRWGALDTNDLCINIMPLEFFILQEKQ